MVVCVDSVKSRVDHAAYIVKSVYRYARHSPLNFVLLLHFSYRLFTIVKQFISVFHSCGV